MSKLYSQCHGLIHRPISRWGVRLAALIFCFWFVPVHALDHAATQVPANCQWTEEVIEGEMILRVNSGACNLSELATADSITARGQSLVVHNSIYISAGARLDITGDDFDEVLLESDANGFANIIAEGAELMIRNVSIASYDPTRDGPDQNTEDGRAFIRVDAFVTEAGERRDAHVEIDNSSLSYLGYETRDDPAHFSGYGLSLKVRKETELDEVAVTGRITNSQLSFNYRGFYSYGAKDILFENNLVSYSTDYGVDPHDGSTGFVARNNTIINNGFTGLALSRRCSDAIVENNIISDNGANGVIVHDLSNNVTISGNTITGNGQDGVVIHDSFAVLVEGNKISENRNGIRIFAGSTLVDVFGNEIANNRDRDVFILNGWLEQSDDLSDYSDGALWNARNISRHNDGRVRGVAFVRNRFVTSAVVTIIEAFHVSFIENNYLADVNFEVENSSQIKLDGSRATQPAQYRLLQTGDDVGDYVIHPNPFAEISVDTKARLSVSQGMLFMPSGNPNFFMNASGVGPSEIVIEGGTSQRQSAVMTPLPFLIEGGTITVSRVEGSFYGQGTQRIVISSTDWAEVALRSAHDACQLMEWTILDQASPESNQMAFYTARDEILQPSQFVTSRFRQLTLDVRCV